MRRHSPRRSRFNNKRRDPEAAAAAAAAVDVVKIFHRVTLKRARGRLTLR